MYVTLEKFLKIYDFEVLLIVKKQGTDFSANAAVMNDSVQQLSILKAYQILFLQRRYPTILESIHLTWLTILLNNDWSNQKNPSFGYSEEVNASLT